MDESDLSKSANSPTAGNSAADQQPSTILAYPLPPMQYIDSINPDNLPEPPSPITDGFYHMFGQKISLDDAIIAPLENHGTKRLYPKTEYDHKKELKKINASILVNFLDLIDVLVKCPDTDKRMEKCNDLASLFINFHHLINELRPHQARETLRVWMDSQKKSRYDIIKKLNQEMEKVSQLVQNFQESERELNKEIERNKKNEKKSESGERSKSQSQRIDQGDISGSVQANEIQDLNTKSIDDIMCDIVDNYFSTTGTN